MNQATPSLGPGLMGTLVTANAQASLDAYCSHLQMQITEHNAVSADQARLWQTPALQGAPCWLLTAKSGASWLRIIEDSSCQPLQALQHTGWMSLEICVKNVDALHPTLSNSPFTEIGAPANLDISDDIRAMQVVGPAGEVLYLTEIKAPVPPFELPQARCEIDTLFIPVLCCHNREQSLAFYQQFPHTNGISFDTKITVINNSYDYPIDKKHPVATLQLRGSSLIEIDQIAEAQLRPCGEGRLPSGIAMISFEVENLDTLPFVNTIQTPTTAPYFGRRTAVCRGAAGEWVELIEQPTTK